MTHAIEAAAKSLVSAGRRALGDEDEVGPADPNQTSLPASVGTRTAGAKNITARVKGIGIWNRSQDFLKV